VGGERREYFWRRGKKKGGFSWGLGGFKTLLRGGFGAPQTFADFEQPESLWGYSISQHLLLKNFKVFPDGCGQIFVNILAK